ncbi:amylopullulanase, partial [Streptococcus agalactiae]|nr:amylopullulanase [Streptococcus agalactiae]
MGAPSPTLKVANQAPQIENGYFRLHLKELPQGHPVESTGLWIWGDVDQPSSNWPNGAIPMTDAKKDDYGYYVDFKLSEKQRKQISFLINNKAGTNLSGDHHISLLRPEMNQVWIDEKYGIHTYQPLKEGYVRINYLSSSGNYDHLSAWLFKDVANPSTTWPDGSNFVNQGLYGRYIDVPLKTNAKEIGFLILDESKTGDAVKVQPNDYVFRDLANHN